MEHPPYSPYLANDFHIFGPVKEALRGRIFSSDEEVIGAVQNILARARARVCVLKFKLRYWLVRLITTYFRNPVENSVQLEELTWCEM
jgi:hypothetical protein